MPLTLQEIRSVARLARLALEDEQLAAMQQQLGSILEYVDQLQTLPTDGVEPLAHPLPVQNVFREDAPAASLTPDQALANAPNRLADYFGVPAVFGSDELLSH